MENLADSVDRLRHFFLTRGRNAKIAQIWVKLTPEGRVLVMRRVWEANRNIFGMN